MGNSFYLKLFCLLLSKNHDVRHGSISAGKPVDLPEPDQIHVGETADHRAIGPGLDHRDGSAIEFTAAGLSRTSGADVSEHSSRSSVGGISGRALHLVMISSGPRYASYCPGRSVLVCKGRTEERQGFPRLQPLDKRQAPIFSRPHRDDPFCPRLGRDSNTIATRMIGGGQESPLVGRCRSRLSSLVGARMRLWPRNVKLLEGIGTSGSP